MISRVLFSSKKTEWETPDWLFKLLDKEFHFTLDVCAVATNSKCNRYITPEQDALKCEWAPNVCWMNPPYGRNISDWVSKAFVEAQKGATVVCLLPARTDTTWWHKYVMRATEIRFVKGRLKFKGAVSSAPFPSCIVVFQPCKNKCEPGDKYDRCSSCTGHIAYTGQASTGHLQGIGVSKGSCICPARGS